MTLGLKVANFRWLWIVWQSNSQDSAKEGKSGMIVMIISINMFDWLIFLKYQKKLKLGGLLFHPSIHLPFLSTPSHVTPLSVHLLTIQRYEQLAATSNPSYLLFYSS